MSPALPKRVLVTGGAGFIGSHLTRRLLDQGHDVLVVDNFYSSTRANLYDLLDEPRFELMRHDVTFPLYVEVDEIFHLACPASPVFYQRDPVATTKTCVHGSINMLGLAKRTGAKILLASTSEVYGDPAMHPQEESYWGNVNPIGLRSCYDEGKRCAETLFFDYYRQHDLPIKVARIFNTYGPNMLPNDGRVVSNFIMQALKGQDLTIFGDGEQTRSFCYVEDLVSGLIALMDSPPEVTGPINIGNPGDFTMLELAEKVIALVGGDSKVVHEPLPTDDPVRRKPDIDKAQSLLGWSPTVSLDEGLKPTVEYFRGLVARESRSLPDQRGSRLMRFYLAWQYITGYSTSGMHELVKQGHTVKLMHQEALVHPPFLAPFDDAELTEGLDASSWTGQAGRGEAPSRARGVPARRPGGELVAHPGVHEGGSEVARQGTAGRGHGPPVARYAEAVAGPAHPAHLHPARVRRRLDARRRAGRVRAAPRVQAARDHHRALHLRGLVLHRPAAAAEGRLRLHRTARRHQGRRRPRRGLPQVPRASPRTRGRSRSSGWGRWTRSSRPSTARSCSAS